MGGIAVGMLHARNNLCWKSLQGGPGDGGCEQCRDPDRLARSSDSDDSWRMRVSSSTSKGSQLEIKIKETEAFLQKSQNLLKKRRELSKNKAGWLCHDFRQPN